MNDENYEMTRALHDFSSDYREQEKIIAQLIETLRPFAWYFDVNDCTDRSEDDALEVPVRDLRIAFELFEAMGWPVTPVSSPSKPE